MFTTAMGFTNSTWSSAHINAYTNALTSLYYKLTPHQTSLSADYTTPIDWSSMQDTYNNPDVPPVNQAEIQVAQLSYEAGIAVSMGYGVCGSEASYDQVPPALINHFYYDPSATDPGFNYSNSDQDQMVAELQWLRPFLFGGNDHMWLISGYDLGPNPPLYWMNMGWGAGSSGWYTLDDANGHTNISDFVYGLAPLSVVGFVGASSSGIGSPNSPYQNIEEALSKAPDHATLIFQAGSVNTFSASSLVINRPLTLKGYQATITK